jgi:hypothetical protein
MQREILTLVVQTISEKWVQFQWPKDWANMEFMIDLSFLELIPIMLALDECENLDFDRWTMYKNVVNEVL